MGGLTTLLLAACGGGTSATSTSTTPAGNGESSKTGQQVANDAADALEKAGAAHLTGTGTSDGKPMTVDLHLQDADAAGTMTMDGGTLEITTTGGKFYVRASAPFWTAQGVPAQAVPALAGKWVIVPSDAAKDFGQFTLKGMADELRKPTDATIEPKVHTDTLNGQKVVVVTQSDGSTLDVAATGTPYPLQSVDKGATAGTMTVGEFGKRTTITAPTGALDLSQLAGGGA
ncbi:MAG: hypothetical protein ACXVW8_17420 [Nocardioidaceae bacterium]